MIIIKTAHSRLQVARDGLLTALAWIAFLYLLAAGIRAFVPRGMRGLAVPMVARLLPDLRTLLLYALVALGIGALLFAWAGYNALRYGALDRRKPAPALTRQALARRFDLDAGQLSTLHDSQIVHILHDETGNILQLQANDGNSNASRNNVVSLSH